MKSIFMIKYYGSIHMVTKLSKQKINCLLFPLLLVITSCDEFLHVELPNSKIATESVFTDDITSNSAMTGIYVNLIFSGSFSGGDVSSVMMLAGLSSDELRYNYTGSTGAAFKEFNENNINANNEIILKIWTNMYSIIYQANSIIEGLSHSTGTTTTTRNQLLGEAHFIRAFTHFYLVNLFGQVPLITSTDYTINSVIPRSSTSDVYRQIEDDLKTAQELLTEKYPTSERIRPNRSVATALLARVYLYEEKWQDAEMQASNLIQNENYELVQLNNTFLGNSKEAIWQLKPNSLTRNTNEGAIFILTGSPNPSRPASLNDPLINSFEPGDLRYTNWIGNRVANGITYYYAYKYKIRTGPESFTPTPVTEYSMVLRLAEQYLIRAESRAYQNNLTGAIDDIDAIRVRAGLPLIKDINPNINLEDLLLLIEQERRLELFAEWGHRWLDVKRTSRADDILQALKPFWTSDDVLYPIPQSELNKNRFLGN